MDLLAMFRKMVDALGAPPSSFTEAEQEFFWSFYQLKGQGDEQRLLSAIDAVYDYYFHVNELGKFFEFVNDNFPDLKSRL